MADPKPVDFKTVMKDSTITSGEFARHFGDSPKLAPNAVAVFPEYQGPGHLGPMIYGEKSPDGKSLSHIEMVHQDKRVKFPEDESLTLDSTTYARILARGVPVANGQKNPDANTRLIDAKESKAAEIFATVQEAAQNSPQNQRTPASPFSPPGRPGGPEAGAEPKQAPAPPAQQASKQQAQFKQILADGKFDLQEFHVLMSGEKAAAKKAAYGDKGYSSQIDRDVERQFDQSFDKLRGDTNRMLSGKLDILTPRANAQTGETGPIIFVKRDDRGGVADIHVIHGDKVIHYEGKPGNLADKKALDTIIDSTAKTAAENPAKNIAANSSYDEIAAPLQNLAKRVQSEIKK